MKPWKLFCVHLLAAIVSLSALTSTAAHAAVRGFAQVTYPNGVAVNQKGEVFVHSLSILGDGGLYKFAPNGSFMGRNPYLFGEIRLVADEVNGVLWGVETKGALYAINPDTLQAQEFLNLRNLAGRPVWNMLRGELIDLIMINPQYGDIALRRIDENNFDLFITGQSATGGFPFVVRLSFRPTLQADIVVASFPRPNPIIPPPLDTQPSGIAVNAQGTVLTTFPKDVYLGRSPIYLAAFDADFPEAATVPDFVPALEHAQVYSTGMTEAPDNGFYFVTTAQGLGCGLGPALVHSSSSLNNTSCLADFSALGMGVMNPDDVAVEPGKRFVYVTMRQNHLVLQVDVPYLAPPARPTVLTVAPASGATDVAADSSVTATFSEEMDAATINGATFTLSSGGVRVQGAVTYHAGSNTASFTPASNLSGSTTYTATISAAVTNIAGATMVAPRTWSFTTATQQRSLTTSIIGKGSINSLPGGIACTTGNAGACTKLFPDGVTVTLIPTESSDSIFTNWSGGCTTLNSGNCLVAMTAAKAVTATFIDTPAARIAGGAGYNTLGLAYNSAATGSTIQLRSMTLPEHLIVANQPKRITLKGGYDKRYSSNAHSRTVIDGAVVLRAGSLTVEKLAVR